MHFYSDSSSASKRTKHEPKKMTTNLMHKHGLKIREQHRDCKDDCLTERQRDGTHISHVTCTNLSSLYLRGLLQMRFGVWMNTDNHHRIYRIFLSLNYLLALGILTHKKSFYAAVCIIVLSSFLRHTHTLPLSLFRNDGA